MAEKKTKASGTEMSQVKHDLLQQALQQVKVLKAKLESAEQADSSLLQALKQIASLKKQLNSVEVGSIEFEQVLRQVKAKWVLGLTATPVRYDGHHPIIVMQCGPIRYRIRHRDVDSGIAEYLVLPRFTTARLPEYAQHYDTQEIITELVKDEQRNQTIIDDVLQAVAERRTPLVLTKRKDHLQILRDKLEGKVENIIVYHGGLGLKKVDALTKQLEEAHEDRVVLAIGQCIGEGFDDSRLDTLFLAMPISFSGRLEQYVGRLHRAHEGKSVVKIYDYVDAHIEKMYRMFKKRQTVYKQIGYNMEMPL